VTDVVPVPSPARATVPPRRPRRLFAAAAVGLLFLLPLSYFFGGTVLRFATNKGELVIQTDVKDIEVTIKNGAILVHDRARDRRFTLTPGDYDVEVREDGDDGLRFATKRFTITRGGTETFRATLELAKGHQEAPPAAPPTPPARVVALDALDPVLIPAAERIDGQPKELVAVIGSHARRVWGVPRSIAISPDGKLAAVNVDTGTTGIVVWDVATQTPKWRLGSPLPNHTAAGSVAFSPDGRKLYAGRAGNGAYLTAYDLTTVPPTRVPFATAQRPKDRELSANGHYFHLCEDGRTLAVHGYRDVNFSLRSYDVGGGRPRQAGAWDIGRPRALWVAPRANLIVALTADGAYRRALVREGKFVQNPSPLAIPKGKTLRSLSPDGKRAVVVSDAGAEVWALDGPVPRLAHEFMGRRPGRNESYTFSPDGRWLTSSYGVTALFRLRGTVATFVGSLDETGAGRGSGQVAFTRDGNTAVVGSPLGLIRFWDLSGEAPKERSPFDPATAFQTPVLGPGGRLLLKRFDAGGRRHQLWDLTGPRPRPALAPTAFLDLRGTGCTARPLADGRWVDLHSFGDYQHRFFAIRDGAWQPEAGGFGTDIAKGAVSADGRLLATIGRDSADRLVGWDLAVRPPKQAWAASFPARPVGLPVRVGGPGFVLSGDGKVVAVGFPPRPGEAAGELLVWKDPAANPKPAMTIRLPLAQRIGWYQLALSPDGRLIAHTKRAAEEIVVEDISGPAPKEVARIQDYLGNGATFWLSFDTDGRRLAWTCARGVRVLDVATRQVVWRWDAPGHVDWVAFAPDGRHLITHNANQTVYVLRLAPPPLAARADADRRPADRPLPAGPKADR
jgi:WD40 repeat protein